MKLIHLIAAAFFLPLGLNAQVFFATPTNTQDNDIPVSAIELPDNRYAFAVYNKHGNMWFYSNSDVTLFLTDSGGGVIHQRTFKNNKARYLWPRQLFFQDNKIILTTLVDSTYYEPESFRITVMDTALTIVSDKVFDLGSDDTMQYIWETYSFVNNQKLFNLHFMVLNGNFNTGHPVLTLHDFDGNLLSTKLIDTTVLPFLAGKSDYSFSPLNMYFSNQRIFITAYVARLDVNGQTGTDLFHGVNVIEFDTAMNYVTWYKLNSSFFPPTFRFSLETYQTHSVALSNNSMIMRTQINEELNFWNTKSRIGLIKYNIPDSSSNNSLQLQNFVTLPDSTIGDGFRDQGYNSIARYQDKIFTIGVDYHSSPNAPGGTAPAGNTLIVAGFDTSLNLLWSKYISQPEIRFGVWNILATSDGGCLLLAARYDDNNPTAQYDHYIFKLDGNGNYLSVTELDVSKESMVKLYPNPATDVLNMEMKEAGTYTVQLSDMTGKVLHAVSFTGQKTSFNLSHLSAGMYTYKVADKSGKAKTGLWLKK